MDLHPDFKDLLAEFVRGGVRFALVGGYAVGFHAKARATKDLDLLVSGEGDNLQRVSGALDRFGAPRSVVAAASTMEPTDVLFLGVEPVRIDILRAADGVDTEEVLARAEALPIGDLTIPVIGLDDLIANKRAADRPRDRSDVQLLEKARARKHPLPRPQ